MKRLFTFIFGVTLLLVSVSATAQDRDLKKEYEEFRNRARKQYNDFRDRANAEYAEFMRKAWERYRVSPAIPIPPSPDPVEPPVFDPKTEPDNKPVPYEEIIPLPQPVPPPQPVAPLPPPPTPVKQMFPFLFYNTECKVGLESGWKIRLSDLSEESISRAWTMLSDSRYNSVITDCLKLRRTLNLCDWAYIRLVREMSEKYYESSTSNEAVLFQMYILTQSGYKVRIAKTNSRLVLLIPSRNTIYEHSYLNIGGVKYYLADQSLKDDTFHIFDHEFPKEQFISLQLEQPSLTVSETSDKEFVSECYPEIKVCVRTNKNLIDFFNSYPRTPEWNLYSEASISNTLKDSLYPVLCNAVAGCSETDAANRLINFVQTAFDYQTDGEQFGYERPLFGDELFYYPASDCEDRSILYSILVRELLGLDVVLLHYPGHLATAVCFNEDVEGDYLIIDDKKFTVCDPTYIGAPVGNAMTAFKDVEVIVIK
ncbi:MAG: hypothetical protein LBP72_05655 [Dysgonamonadaceae bacterium]|jgi:hypothetical protein|nr:hypothetical protein [Dysgonamonadaceae bacterium]